MAKFFLITPLVIACVLFSARISVAEDAPEEAVRVARSYFEAMDRSD